MNSKSEGDRDRHIWVVDRIESGIAVMLRDDDARQRDVPVSVLPEGVRNGAVLQVPEVQGRPVWSHAVIDEAIRSKRLREAEEVLRRLRGRDPGGDVVL